MSLESFAPGQSITREQMVVMTKLALDRHAGKTTSTTTKATFKDAASISAWAQFAVAVTVDKGIIAGRTDGNFAPKATATRAEAAKVISLLLSASVK